MKELTHERLRETLHYDPETGAFTSLVKRSRVNIGDVCGYKKNTGYVTLALDSKVYQAHNLAFFYVNKRWPKDILDHINGVRYDNRISNLRESTTFENHKNQKMAKNNSSGVTGVTWNKKHEVWKVYISSDGVRYNLGSYKNIQTAIDVRRAAEIKYNYSVKENINTKVYKHSKAQSKNHDFGKYTGGRKDYPQSRLKQFITYKPDTGEFIRNCNVSGNLKGSKAGWITPEKNGLKYHQITLDSIVFKAHRLAWLYMTGKWPKYTVDHINGDGTDNRWVNLRDVPLHINAKNQKSRVKSRPKTNPYVGVKQIKSSGDWKASITSEGITHQLGIFSKCENAIAARKKAELKFGFTERHGT